MPIKSNPPIIESPVIHVDKSKGYQAFKIQVKSLMRDRRFIALIACLLAGCFIKLFVLIVSISVVETFHTTSGMYTHGILFGIGDPQFLEHFDDWDWYYRHFIESFLQGNLPYTSDFYQIVPGHPSYLYPPLFLYLLVAFHFLPGSYSFVGAIVFWDLITGGCLYIIALRITHSINRSCLAAILYFINPISLWWTDYLWFGEALFTSFLIIGILFLVESRYSLASLFLALSLMTKQVAVLFVPLLLILALYHSWRTLLNSMIILVSICLLLSMPYLLIIPNEYLFFLIRGAGAFLYLDEMPPINSPIQLFASFWFLPAPLRNIIALAVASYAPLTILLLTAYSLLLVFGKKESIRHPYGLVAWNFILILIFYTFFPRGIFKWYHVGIVPFFTLAIVTIPNQRSSSRSSSTSTPSRWQKITDVLCQNLILGSIAYILVSLVLTLSHRWLGPGILLLCLISYTCYWFTIGCHRTFPAS